MSATCTTCNGAEGDILLTEAQPGGVPAQWGPCPDCHGEDGEMRHWEPDIIEKPSSYWAAQAQGRCPSLSPKSGVRCLLVDDPGMHDAGHEGLSPADPLHDVRVSWPTSDADWERWARQWSQRWAVEPAPERRRWRVSFAWYDLWVGAFYSRKDRVWYFCPLPMLLITWDRQQPKRRRRG